MLLESKSAPKEEQRPTGVFFVVYRGPHGNLTSDPISRELAFSKLNEFVAGGYPTHGGRRLLITGPDYCVQPDDVDDPLLIDAREALALHGHVAARAEVMLALLVAGSVGKLDNVAGLGATAILRLIQREQIDTETAGQR